MTAGLGAEAGGGVTAGLGAEAGGGLNAGLGAEAGLSGHFEPKSGHSVFEKYRPIVPPTTIRKHNAATIISTTAGFIPEIHLVFFFMRRS